MAPRTRGNRQGSVRKLGRTWYLRYLSPDGRLVEKTTDAATKTEATTLLNREIERVWGRKGTVKQVFVKDLLPLIEADYINRGQDYRYVTKRWAHLEPAFGQRLVGNVTTASLDGYVVDRVASGAAASTVQQEIACLRRMMRLGYAATPRLVDLVPAFPTVRVDNVRRDFFEQADLDRVVAELPEHLRPLATVAYWLGWRKGELLSLTWSQVDLSTGRVRLYVGTTKNKLGRVAVLPDAALSALRAWRERTLALERRTGRIVQYVFHRRGKRIKDFYFAWRAACERAKLAGRWFHDFRRSGVRGYVRVGISEPVAMAISGHKTRSIFDRYNIVSEGDLEDAARKMSKGNQALSKRRARQGTKR